MGVFSGSDLWAIGISTAGFLAGLVNSVFTRSGDVSANAGDYTASLITNTPAGGIAAVTVQAAIDELDTEKAPAAGSSAIVTVGAVAVTAHEGALDHDALLNFLSTEHFLQSAIVATGILGSGSIAGGFGNIATGGTVSGSNLSGTNTGDEISATAATEGIVELATIAEVDTGTDIGRAITPAGLAGSALQAKVDGIESLADVTDATNVSAAGATMNTDVDVSGNSWVLDEDNLVSDSDTKLATQQSIKAYVDGVVASSVDFKGGYNAATNTPDLDTTPAGVDKGDMYVVTAAGTFFTTAVEVGDVIIAEIDNAAVEADWAIVNKNLDDASIKVAYENNANTNAYTDAEQTIVGNTSGSNSGDEPAASLSVAGIIEIATGVETNTGTDATRAVSPDGLDDWVGSVQVTTLGIIGAGTWEGSLIDHERGGLEVDASAFSGLLKITGGSTTAITAPAGTVVGTSDTQTLTNKRIDPRQVTTVSTASWTINSDDTNDAIQTALGAALTVNAPTGTPVNSQVLLIRIKDDATGRAISWNAIFRVINVTLPVTTVSSKTMYIGCKYNTADTKWDVLAVGEEA